VAVSVTDPLPHREALPAIGGFSPEETVMTTVSNAEQPLALVEAAT
jgi:hypothetical protein